MITSPTEPLVALNDVIVGARPTIVYRALVVPPSAFTKSRYTPGVMTSGTVKMRDVLVLAGSIVSATPSRVAETFTRFVPVIVTTSFARATDGENASRVGDVDGGLEMTVNAKLEVLPLSFVNTTGASPSATISGTVNVTSVAVLDNTEAVTPPIVTSGSMSPTLRFVPEIVIESPRLPEAALSPDATGADVEPPGLVALISATVSLIHTSVVSPAIVMNRSTPLCGSFVVPVHVAPELIMMPSCVTLTASVTWKEATAPYVSVPALSMGTHVPGSTPETEVVDVPVMVPVAPTGNQIQAA